MVPELIQHPSGLLVSHWWVQDVWWVICSGVFGEFLTLLSGLICYSFTVPYLFICWSVVWFTLLGGGGPCSVSLSHVRCLNSWPFGVVCLGWNGSWVCCVLPLLFGHTKFVRSIGIAVYWLLGGMDSHVHVSLEGKKRSRFSGFFTSWSVHFLRKARQVWSLLAWPCTPHRVHVRIGKSHSNALWFSLHLAQISLRVMHLFMTWL